MNDSDPDCGCATFADHPLASTRVAEATLRALANAASRLRWQASDVVRPAPGWRVRRGGPPLRDEASVQRNLHAREGHRDGAISLGRLGLFAERALVEPRPLALRVQLDAGDSEAPADGLEMYPGHGVDSPGRTPASVRPADRAIEKQPAWATPISSSGFVPDPSSNREQNE